MTTSREQRGSCLIETGARNLQDGRHWQPWLRLTRRAGGVSTACTFDRLKPVFASAETARAYAAELGRNLADQGWGLDPSPVARKPKSVPGSLAQAYAQSRAYRARKSPLERGCRTARYMARTLAGLFARGPSAIDLAPRSQTELYLAAAAKHAEFERRLREMERSAASIAVTFSH